MAKDFILEIGVEPLPARFLAPALEQLLENARRLLSESRLGHAGARSLGTFRRLSLILTGVEEKSSPLTREVQGPPARLWKDEQGRLTPQALGFARKQGIDPGDLQVARTPKGEFLLARATLPGEPALQILSRLLPELIGSLEFPKSMEWEESRFRFARPIRSLIALYGMKVVPFRVAGVRSGRLLRGLAGGLSLPEAGRYQAALKDMLVLVDAEERKKELLRRLEAAARQAGGRLDLDQDLIQETLSMTEYPVPVAGKFREDFLSLPAGLLSVVLKKQLKFFPLLKQSGLAAAFIGVRDGISEGQELVREGYERVLAARFDDAAFYFARDSKSRLEEKLPLLEGVTYQKDLGSMAKKAVRVSELSAWLCEQIRQEREIQEAAVCAIARLCYADLVSEVVKEFPELQGAMGGIYARRDGLEERVALGIEQFHHPAGARSPVPATLEGALVSLAGKLDSLAGSFAVGLIPTGSADPFALRRQALGALRILLEKQLPIDLEKAIEKALSLQPVSLEADRRALSQLTDFVWARAQSFFEEMGYRTDEIRSIRSGALGDLPRALKRLAAVHSVRQNPDFERLAAAFKRAANILRQARLSTEEGLAPQRGLLREEAEISLYDALVQMEGQVREKLSQDGFEPGLKALAAIKPHLDRFFDDVMVMAEDAELRSQRLGLLARIVRLFNSVADLSELQAVPN